jgi:hypothetical protein
MGFLRRKQEPEAVIDLREPEVEAAPSRPVWGSPVPCPSCNGRGYLDHIDPYKEIMYLHCIECFTKYEVTKAELEPDTASSF